MNFKMVIGSLAVVWAIVVVVMSIVKMFNGEPSESSPPIEPKKAISFEMMPPDQQSFINAVLTAQAGGDTAANDMQLGAIMHKRNKEICKVLKSKSVKGWVGEVVNVSANSDGKGVFGVKVAPKVEVTTWNNALSDIIDNTLIEPGSNIFERASSLKEGQIVKFSGTFGKPFEENECIRESSISLAGKVSAPEFIMKFTDLELMQSE